MPISRKTFNTVKDILKELDQRRSETRETPAPEQTTGERLRATPKRPADGDREGDSGASSNGTSGSGGAADRPGGRATGRGDLSDQLIG